MPTYVTLGHFTEQGIRDIKNAPKRAEAFKTAAKQMGCTVKEVVYTQGQYDVITIVDAPDETTMNALVLSVMKIGNVRGQTLRAYSVAEMEKLVEKVA
jgi:uncharacterized protein with GYD domain